MNEKLKRLFSFGLVLILVYGAVLLLSRNVHQFNPQYLVETSVLKNKGFAEPVEIISPQSNIKAYLYEEHTNPIVSVSFLFQKAGVAYEPENKIGIGALLSSMLLKGAGRYKMTEYHDILEQHAIEIDFENNKDDFEGSLKFIKKDISLAAKMLNLALTRPLFEAKLFLQSKADLKNIYLKKLEQADSLIAMEAFKKLFPTHSYHHHRYGSLKTQNAITIKDLQTYMQQHLTTDRLIVGISGDVTDAEAEQLLDKMFKGIPLKARAKDIPSIQADIASSEYHQKKQLPQTIGLFFAHAVPRLDKDFYPLTLAMQIFSGTGLTSRVQKAARENQGLTYGVYGHIVNFDKTDLIYGRFSATADNFAQLKKIISEEWIKMGYKGIKTEELEQAKNFMIASEPLRYADIENISTTLVYMQKLKLGLDFLQKRNTYIENVTLEQVNQAASRYFKPDNLRFMSIGD